MSFDPANIQAIGVGISAFLATLTVTFVIISAKKDKTGRALIIMLLSVVWWSWFGFFYHVFDSILIARVIRVFSVSGIVGISVGFVAFATAYLEEKDILRKGERAILRFLQAGGIFLCLVLFSDIFIQNGYVVGPLESAPKETLAPNAGPLLAILIAHYLFCIFFGGYLILRRANIETEISGKREADIILACTTLALILGGTRFAPWYGLDFAPFLGGLALPLFSVGSFYVMARYGTFNVRLVAVEFLVFSIWTFMFFQALLNSDIISALPDIILLIATIIVGIFLIRSVLKEGRVRMEVDLASKEIAELNSNLECRVFERTKELERAGEHIKAIVEHLPIGLIEVSDKKILRRVNKSAADMLGFDEDIKTDINLTPKEEALWMIVEVAFRSELNYLATEVFIKGRDFEFIKTPLVMEEGEGGFIILIRDITHEKELNRAKDEFLTILAHKLRTPMTALYWAMSSFSEERAGVLTKEQKEIVSETEKRAEGIIDLIDDFLIAAEITSGKFYVNRKKENIVTLLDRAIKQAQELYDKNINCSVSIAGDIPEISVDSEKISLAFKNILSNAFIYTPSGGMIGVSAEYNKPKIIIKISDTGIGIPKNEEELLFQKFSRGAGAMRINTEGSGLGLFISHYIINVHGGNISVVSKKEKEKGTIVTVELPE